MEYGICPVAIAPIRNSAAHKSEMLSQLLFGETVEILEEKGRSWKKVRCQDDNFVGWVAANQLEELSVEEFEHYSKDYAYVFEVFHPAMSNKHFLPLTLGARLPAFDGMMFSMGQQPYTFSGQAVLVQDVRKNAEMMIKMAQKYLHSPYLWGGRSSLGIDARGLVHMACKMSGVDLPRTLEGMLEEGENINFVNEAQAGDIAFFENFKGRISHVGILLSPMEIIHAHGSVRIDRVDHYGLFNTKERRYSHRLRLVKRFLPMEGKKESVKERPIVEILPDSLF